MRKNECVVPVGSQRDHLHTLLRATSFSRVLAWLSAKMGAYVASVVRYVRMLVGTENFELACDPLGGRH